MPHKSIVLELKIMQKFIVHWDVSLIKPTYSLLHCSITINGTCKIVFLSGDNRELDRDKMVKQYTQKYIMIRSIILLLASPLGLCTHFTPIQTIHNYAAVEGIAIAPNTTYVAASDYDGTLRIYFQQDNQLSLHQTIIDNFNYIWQVSVSDDDWLAVCWSHNPAIYVLNSSNNQFQLVQKLDGEAHVVSVQISADHKYVALGKDDGSVPVYQFVDGGYQLLQTIEGTGDRAMSLSMTPDARELVIGRDGSAVSVYVRAGDTFLPNTTINLPDSSIKRVKISDNHQCLAVGSEYNYAAIYSRSGQDLLLTQNITNIPAYSLDLTSDCKHLLIGSMGSALYFESEGSSVFKQVQYLDAQYEFVMRSKMSKDQQLILLGNTSGRMYVYSRDPQLTSQ